ncbi:MAG: hypothetical protein Q9174_003253 [Haloplaca sp. 1 TL-2023]
MFSTKAKRFFSSVKFGLPTPRFYLKNKATQNDLDEMIREIVRTEPGLEEKAHTASVESGLHATKADPDFHWTVKFYDERMKHLRTIHIKLHDQDVQLYKTLKRKPSGIVAEAKKVEEGQKREAERRRLVEEAEKAASKSRRPTTE